MNINGDEKININLDMNIYNIDININISLNINVDEKININQDMNIYKWGPLDTQCNAITDSCLDIYICAQNINFHVNFNKNVHIWTKTEINRCI